MMLANLLLAFAWAALNGQFSLESLATGFLLGHLVMRILARGGILPASDVRRIDRALGLLTYLLWQIVVANFRVARDVVSIRYRMRPGIIRLPLDVKTDGEILLLAAMINITPGSVALAVSPDRSVMYVHVMHIRTPDDARQVIKDGFERRVLQLRGRGKQKPNAD